MRVLAAMAVLALAGCGVEGDPVPPTMGRVVIAGSGDNVSAGVGVKVGNVQAGASNHGVNVGVGVGL